MQVLAVDFGTSNTVAAVRSGDGGPRLLTIDGSPLVPSAVFLTDDGTLAVGRDAERQSRIDPSRYEPNPKRRIDDGELLLGASVLPVSAVIGAVFGRIADEVRRQLGGPPDQLRLTHPARWGRRRTETLTRAARDAGLIRSGTDPVLIPEPVAAATHHAALRNDGRPDGGSLAVYDLGAGTVDIGVVRRSGSRYEVVAEAGLPDLGGLDFDQAIIDHIGRSSAVAADPEGWQRLLHPVDSLTRRQQRALVTDVRDAKEALSRYSHTDIALPPPFGDVQLTRAEFEELIRPTLGRSVELLRHTVTTVRPDARDVAGIYLVGGSSRIPLVARMIQETLGVTPTTLDQPETSVATGALCLPVAAPAPAARPTPPPSYRPAPPTARPPAADRPGPVVPPAPSTRARKAARRRWPIAAAAVAVLAAVGVVLAVVLPGRGGNDGAGAGQPPTSASAPSGPTASGPTASGRTDAGGVNRVCTHNFDDCVDDSAMRTYLRPAYTDMTSCQKNTAFGASFPGLTESTHFVTCRFRDSYQVVFGRSTSVATFRDLLISSISGSQYDVQTRGTWKRGTKDTLVETDGKGGGLYWDDTTTGIFGMALNTTHGPADISDWWAKRFNR